MSLTLLFVLLPLAVTGQLTDGDFTADASRTFRQLDLGDGPSQVIDPSLVINGYLPPPSSSRPSSVLILGEQTRDNFELSAPKQSDNLIGDDGNSAKLSKFLSPPYDEGKTTGKVVFITTAKPAAKPFEQPRNNQNEFVVIDAAEPTLESRNYLPPQPEYKAAAQTPQVVVQPVQQQQHDHHDHHHHHHHHDENFDICTDAFHSFLCTPLKARKRITGAFPEHLKGQASFSQYQRVLPEQPPSNGYLPPTNQYLPPVNDLRLRSTDLPRVTASSTRIPSTTARPTTQRPRTLAPSTTAKIIAQPSNLNDRAYLPPFPDNGNFNSVTGTTLSSSTAAQTVKLQSPFASPSTIADARITGFDTFGSTFSQSSTTQRPSVTPSNLKFTSFPSTVASPTTRKIVQSSVSANEITRYSTPKIQNPSAATFAQSQASSFFGTTSSQHSAKPTFQAVPSSIRPFTETTRFAPSSTTTRFAPSSTATFSSVSTNFQKLSSPFAAPTPKIDNSYLPPFEPKYTAAPAHVTTTTVKPITAATRNLLFSTQKVVEEVPILDGGYLPPLQNRQPPQINVAVLMELPKIVPEVRPEQTNNVVILENGPENHLPEPSSTLSSSTGGYSYPTPEKRFPLPSEKSVVVTTTTARPSTTTTTTTLRPSTPVASETRPAAGYVYPKPVPDFPLPSEKNLEVIETAQSAYFYPKPDNELPLPSEPQVVQEPSTTPTTPAPSTLPPPKTGYQYPKPEQSFDLPERKGYSYPKPENPLELPTERKFQPLFPNGSSSTAVPVDLGSAEFIPVNKLDKRSKSSDVLPRTRRFGERLKKLERKTTN